ncbi:MAG: hypothetical protein DRN81_02355 [Thermoproteota archaeon]|nr:MAG: hypothetical protein DRN81_02355 [Candidatus Korarchaeota archaeon]
MRLILLALLFSSCGNVIYVYEEPDYQWDELLDHYYWMLVDEAEEYGMEVPPQETVRVAQILPDEGQTTAGFCGEHTNGDKVWKAVTIYSKVIPMPENILTKKLVYHEFGHCFLGKGHAKRVDDIMYMFYDSQMVVNFDDALDRFFKNEEEWTHTLEELRELTDE